MQDSRPELLAYHYTEAGQHRDSVAYWQRAARQAYERAALHESESHVQHGLRSVAQLVDASERNQYELPLQILLAAVCRVTKSHDASKVTDALQRAQTLCEQVGDTSQLFSVLRSLWSIYIARGHLATARELSERLIELAQQQQEPALLMEANRDIGTSLFFLGEQTTAAWYFEESRRHDLKQSAPTLIVMYGQGAEAPILLSYQAWSQWLRGYPDQALESMAQALFLAQQLDHIQSYSIYASQCFTQVAAATLHQWRREPDDAQRHVESGLALADKLSGHVITTPRGRTLQGWVLAQRERPKEGIDLLRRSMADYRARGAVLTCTHMLAMLAETYCQIGEIDESLQAVEEALDLVDTYDERWWESDLYRLRAELRLQRDASDILPAAADLQRALQVARQQEAKSLELRAAIGFARLLQQQNRASEARQLLTPIFNWFTEGFDTVDLREAEVLLADLA